MKTMACYATPDTRIGGVVGTRQTNPVCLRTSALPLHAPDAARDGRAFTDTL